MELDEAVKELRRMAAYVRSYDNWSKDELVCRLHVTADKLEQSTNDVLV